MNNRVSLIIPIMETNSLQSLKADLGNLISPVDELVLVHAGYGDVPELRPLSDNNRHSGAEDISVWNARSVKVVPAHGARPGASRNLGAASSSGDILVFIDEGCRIFPGTINAFADAVKNSEGIVWGYEVPILKSPFEEASYLIFAGIMSRFLFCTGLSKGFTYTRSMAMSREIWQKIGGFPAWLRAGEDGLFGARLLESNIPATLCCEAYTGWRPRTGMWSTIRQYWVYGRGDFRASVHCDIQRIKMVIYLFIALLYMGGRKWLAGMIFGAYLAMVSGLAIISGARITMPLTTIMAPIALIIKDISSVGGYIFSAKNFRSSAELARRRKKYLHLQS